MTALPPKNINLKLLNEARALLQAELLQSKFVSDEHLVRESLQILLRKKISRNQLFQYLEWISEIIKNLPPRSNRTTYQSQWNALKRYALTLEE